MTWNIIVFIILAIIAAPLALAGLLLTDDEDRIAARVAAAVTTALAVIVLVIGSITIVGTREIGVVTTFGRPTGELPNGLHAKAPWSKVTEMDGAIQIDTHTGDGAPLVRLANNSMARVDNSVQWRLRPAQVEQMFLDYRNFDNIRENLVTRQLTTALNEAFETVDPLSMDHSDGIDTTQMGEKVAAMLRDRVGEQVEIINVLTPVIHYDEATQKRVDAFNVERANTRIAQQRQQTADAEAKANDILSRSVSRDPNVLVSKCLDASRDNHTSPLGCWPGAAAVPTVPAS